MISNVVARRYAKALIATMGTSKDYDVRQKELAKINDFLTSSPALTTLLNNPSVNVAVKQKILSEVLKKLAVSLVVSRFISLALEKDRLRYLDAILRYFEEIANQKMNRLKVAVKGAYQLQGKQIDKIKERLQQVTGKEIILDIEVDPEIIGGLVVQVGSTIYNGSVKGQLVRLKYELTRG